jgi:hypothetical protein
MWLDTPPSPEDKFEPVMGLCFPERRPHALATKEIKDREDIGRFVRKFTREIGSYNLAGYLKDPPEEPSPSVLRRLTYDPELFVLGKVMGWLGQNCCLLFKTPARLARP